MPTQQVAPQPGSARLLASGAVHLGIDTSKRFDPNTVRELHSASLQTNTEARPRLYSSCILVKATINPAGADGKDTSKLRCTA
jgi:hypothetical protein